MADATTVPKPARSKRGKGKGDKAAKAAKKAITDAAHLAVVLEAAHVTVEIFKREGISCSIFGSLASRLYGAPRCPKDVDLLIYQDPRLQDPWTAERLKKLALDRDPRHFYLTLPKDPQAEFRILWYRQEYLGPSCKVDVLVPGTMHLPNLLPRSSVWIGGVPLVPFPLLLLHKLQGWDDHGIAEEPHKRRKQPQDAADIKHLLAMDGLVDEVVKRTRQLWSDRGMFSEEFEELTRRRVRDYCEAVPKHVGKWRALGFEVPDPVPKTKKEESPRKEEEGVPVLANHSILGMHLEAVDEGQDAVRAEENGPSLAIHSVFGFE